MNTGLIQVTFLCNVYKRFFKTFVAFCNLLFTFFKFLFLFQRLTSVDDDNDECRALVYYVDAGSK